MPLGGETVPEEQVIKLLEETRDLQKLHVENYRDALKHQQESIDVQKRAIRRQKITSLVIGLLPLAFLILLVLSSYPTRG